MSSCAYLGQAFVHGDGIQTSLVAIFGVQPDTFAAFASRVLKTNIGPTDFNAIRAAASDAKVVKAVLRDLDRAGKEHKLAGFERVKSIRLFLEPFSIENGLLTPTCVFPPIRFVFSSYSLQPIQTSELTITATLIQVETQACSSRQEIPPIAGRTICGGERGTC